MKKPLLLSSILLFISSFLFAQAPANDLCNNPNTSVTVGSNCTNVSGTLYKATTGNSSTTSGSTAYDVWYKITTRNTTYPLKISVTAGTGTGTALSYSSVYVEVFSSQCPATGATALKYSNASSTITYSTPSANTNYYVRVFMKTNPNSSTVNYNFNICATQNAANDLCSAPTTISFTTSCTTQNGSLFLARTGSPASTYGTPYGVWYKFTIPSGGASARLAVTLPGGATSLTSSTTFVEVYNSQCPGGTPLIAGDISDPLEMDGYPAATYYFRVFSADDPSLSGSETTWSFQICLTKVSNNDNCAGAVTVSTGATSSSYNLNNASASNNIPVGCALGNPDDDVWFKFMPSTTYATIHLGSLGSSVSGTGLIVQGFSGSCGSLVSAGCGNNEANLTGLTPGSYAYFRVYAPGTGSAGGNTGFNIAITPSSPVSVGSGRMHEVFEQTTMSVPNLLNDPWEITWGPDGYLWITEAKGYRVFRMNPASGARDTVLNISQGSTFFSTTADRAFNLQFDISANNPQGGLAGLALHPKFMDPVSPKNYVYISYVHNYNGAAGDGTSGVFYTNSIVRLTYNTTTKKLESPETICDTLPGSSDHNSQRMIVAPVTVGGPEYLFYAAGDMGAGQFGNRTRPNNAQNVHKYEGKILRWNLEPTGTGSGNDPWIPEDNPYNSLPSKSAIWVTGIRNNQGFAYDAVNNILYGSSHGPYSDDEINIIEKKRNYGHPYVIGFKADENYAGLSAGSKDGSSCPHINSEVYNADSLDAIAPAGATCKDPLFTAYKATQGINYDNYLNHPNANGPWPSEGWSGMDIYKANFIPGWKNSLLVGSLKWGRVLRFRLSNNGQSILPTDGEDTSSYFGSVNRYRDIAFSPDGKDMYVVMDKSSSSSGPSASHPIVPACGGCVQKYTFLGYADVSGKSDIPDAIDVSDVPTNSCTSVTSINISGTNNNLWVPITGPDGNVIAEIKANNQDLGDITTSVYKNNGAIRLYNGRKYLDRNMTITPAVQPTAPVDIRLYLSKAELTALIGSSGSNVAGITNLGVAKNNDGCGAMPGSVPSFITVTYREAHGTNAYVVQGRISSFSSFYFTADPSTLSLELLSFKGTLVKNASFLEWTTTNEKDTRMFIIERSIDSRNFTGIGSVKASGNSTSSIDYNYTDADAANQSSATLYYRLKMVDLDGKFTYSNIITIQLSDIAGKLVLAPNPASHDVKATITSMHEGRAKWQLVDNAGRVVMNGDVNLKIGKNVLPINIASLKGGVYYLILSGAGIEQKVKLQKI